MSAIPTHTLLREIRIYHCVNKACIVMDTMVWGVFDIEFSLGLLTRLQNRMVVSESATLHHTDSITS